MDFRDIAQTCISSRPPRSARSSTSLAKPRLCSRFAVALLTEALFATTALLTQTFLAKGLFAKCLLTKALLAKGLLTEALFTKAFLAEGLLTKALFTKAFLAKGLVTEAPLATALVTKDLVAEPSLTTALVAKDLITEASLGEAAAPFTAVLVSKARFLAVLVTKALPLDRFVGTPLLRPGGGRRGKGRLRNRLLLVEVALLARGPLLLRLHLALEFGKSVVLLEVLLKVWWK